MIYTILRFIPLYIVANIFIVGGSYLEMKGTDLETPIWKIFLWVNGILLGLGIIVLSLLFAIWNV